MNRIGVLQIIDTLDAGGLERVAVNVANHLPGDWYRSHLCTTRAEGTLAELVAPHVQRLRLTRSGRFDRHAVRHLAKYIRAHDIRILHAHGSSLFIAAAAACGTRAAVVWHDHFGRYATEQRPAWLYWLATRRVAGVIAVNQPLADWSRRRLRVAAERVWYLPNFVCEPVPEQAAVELPGRAGLRGWRWGFACWQRRWRTVRRCCRWKMRRWRRGRSRLGWGWGGLRRWFGWILLRFLLSRTRRS